jgi:hypothetical protein
MYAFTRRAAEEQVSAETSCEVAYKARGNVGESADNIAIPACPACGLTRRLGEENPDSAEVSIVAAAPPSRLQHATYRRPHIDAAYE